MPDRRDHRMRSDLTFLDGSSRMGELIRRFDWSATALGPPETWPTSLRTAVSMILASGFQEDAAGLGLERAARRSETAAARYRATATGVAVACASSSPYEPRMRSRRPAAFGQSYVRNEWFFVTKLAPA